MRKPKKAKKTTKRRHYGRIVEVTRKTKKRGAKQTVSYVVRVFTGVSSFENTMTEQRMDDLLPADVADPNLLKGRFCAYEYRLGGKRRITGMGDDDTLIEDDD